MQVGVGYEPLRRLSPLLGDSFSLAHMREDADELAGSLRTWPVTVNDSAHAASLGHELATTVSAVALPFAEKYSTVDALLDEQGDDALTTAALLAAAGRFEAAENALAAFEPRDETRRGRQQKERAVYQLRRWIENRGDLAVPSERPPGPTARAPAAVSEWMPRVAATAVAKLEAIRAVEQGGGDRDPDAVRAALVAEYERRGVRESPLSIENTVERICRPASRGGWRAAADALRRAAAFKSGLADPRLQGGQTPPWLAPPPRAAYRVPTAPDDVWDRVEVAGEQLAWVQEVFEKAPRRGEIVHLEAWLNSPDPSTDELAGVPVFIGERRAGALTADNASDYGPLLRAAMDRAELPCLAARLSRPPTYAGYLLELRRPGAVDDAT
jgi:hypothetical protein